MGYRYRKLSKKPFSEEESYGADDKTKNYISWRRLHQCSAKLSNVSEFASLMSFFAVLAAVELKLDTGESSTGLVIALVCTTSLLVAVTMILKTVVCSIVPYLDSVVDVLDVSRSPHEEMISLINGTWLICNLVCPSLFILDLMIMTWIKFRHVNLEAAYASTAILTPLLIIILLFGIVYYRQIIKPREQEFAAKPETEANTNIGITYYSEDAKPRYTSESEWGRSDNSSDASSRTSRSSLLSSGSRSDSETTLLVRSTEYKNPYYGAMLANDPMMSYGFVQ